MSNGLRKSYLIKRWLEYYEMINQLRDYKRKLLKYIQKQAIILNQYYRRNYILGCKRRLRVDLQACY